jgi:hypothetical protein
MQDGRSHLEQPVYLILFQLPIVPRMTQYFHPQSSVRKDVFYLEENGYTPGGAQKIF